MESHWGGSFARVTDLGRMALQVVYDEREVDPCLVGVCGLYCGSCDVYRAWVEQDAARLERLARSHGVAPAKVLCTGCRTPSWFCFGGDCPIKACAEAHGAFACAECAAFPCGRIERFAASRPERAAVLQNGPRIRELGWYAWVREQDARWRCPSCRAKLSTADAACGGCGRPLITP